MMMLSLQGEACQHQQQLQALSVPQQGPTAGQLFGPGGGLGYLAGAGFRSAGAGFRSAGELKDRALSLQPSLDVSADVKPSMQQLVMPIEVDEDMHLALAHQNYKMGKYKQALEHCNAIYERNSQWTDNLLLLGAIYYQVPYIDVKLASTHVLPALVTLGSDQNLKVKYESIDAFGVVAQQFKNDMIVDKIRIQMDAFLEDGSHEAMISVIHALVVAVPHITDRLREYILCTSLEI